MNKLRTVANGVEPEVHDASTYRNWGCRCLACRVANAAHVTDQRRRRRLRLLADPTLAPHGSSSTYLNWMCRCPRCRAAHTEKRRGQMTEKRQSTGGDQ